MPTQDAHWQLIRVYYEDTDATGVVYHANYLKYFERARTDWLRALGVDQHALRLEHNCCFTLASLQADYLQPARLDDRVWVSAEVHKAGRASIHFDQALRRGAMDGELLARLSCRVACLRADAFKPAALPKHILALIRGEQSETNA